MQEFKKLIAIKQDRSDRIFATRAHIVEKLNSVDAYPTDSTGRKMAIKIYELLQRIDQPSMAIEILYSELQIENHLMLNSTEDEGLMATMILPQLAEGTKMKLTARRALRALVKSGLVNMDGNTSAARYSVAANKGESND